MSLHQRRTHREPVPGCWACRLGDGPNVSPSATPSRASRSLFAAKAEEKTLTTDGEAYRRLRKDGFQPKHVNGSAQLEQRASSRFEIESGRIYDGPNQTPMRDAVNWFEDHTGRGVCEPITTPTDAA